MRTLYPLLLCGLALSGPAAFAQTAANPAQAAPTRAQPSQTPLVIDAGSGRVIQTGRAITNLFAADPKIAEVRPASPTSVFVFGVAPGQTTIAALDQAGNVIGRYEVTVKPSAFSANEVQSALRSMPGSNVGVDASVGGLTLTGQVRTPMDAARAEAVGKSNLGEKMNLDNRVGVTSSVQVNLRVRFAEIARQATRRFGINWSALGAVGKYGLIGASIADPFNSAASPAQALVGGYNALSYGRPVGVDAMLDLLAADNLATILAEPNLTATSGETASFLSGGEYPIPVAQQNNTITIEYKQYGISLAFVPTVLSSGHISLHVRPEVSQLTTQGAIQLGVGNSTIQIPALTVRRAETSVELGSGQSFAIAGLLSSQNTIGNNGLPYANEAPVIGSLFGSNNMQRNDSELVIIVTPYIVRPVDDPSQLKAPTDDYVVPGDFDRVALNRQRARGTGPETISAHLPGQAGFILN